VISKVIRLKLATEAKTDCVNNIIHARSLNVTFLIVILFVFSFPLSAIVRVQDIHCFSRYGLGDYLTGIYAAC